MVSWAPYHLTHLGVSGQLQAELALLTGAQHAMSGGDFGSAEAGLEPYKLADTWVGHVLGSPDRPGSRERAQHHML